MLLPSFSNKENLQKPPKLLRIAVLDSGFTISKYSQNVKFCLGDSRDFTGTGLEDNHGHGTHIVNTIVSNLKSDNYCIIIVKWFDPSIQAKTNETSIKAFEYLYSINIDIVNYSAGGTMHSEYEDYVLAGLLESGVKIFVAAGNDSQNLDKKCNYYPACYRLQKLEVVGNIQKDGKRHPSTNYGKVVTRWEIGVDVVQDTGKKGLRPMTGTSQSCALATAHEANRRFK